jgi:hypothetical protein
MCEHTENDNIVEERNRIRQHSAGVVRRLAGNVVVVFVDVDERTRTSSCRPSKTRWAGSTSKRDGVSTA